MYIIRRRTKDNKYAFKTYDGWTSEDSTGVLDLSDVIRFTKGESSAMKLRPHEDVVWFGCYEKRSK